jgi:putative ABC transport system substrate-binding protein
VGIAQFVHHPALDATREGFLDEMKRLGYAGDDRVQYVYENAEGDISTANSIAQKFAAGRYDLVFPLATPMAQAVRKALSGTGTPVVFGAITDPVSAGLVQSMAKPGDRITGTSDQWPYEGQLKLFREVMPELKNLCVVFNPGEDNTRYAMQQTRSAAVGLGIHLVEAPISGPTDVFESASSIASRCQAFYVPADNTAMAAAPTIVRVADQHRLPVLAGDPGTFKAGCLIGLGVSYYDLGVQSAKLANMILKEGKNAGDLPVVTSQNPQVMVSLPVAKRLGIRIPESVLKRASEIVGGDEKGSS